MNLKQQAAAKAVEYIGNKRVIGLGAGSTIAYLIEVLKDQAYFKDIQFTSSSFSTTQLLLKHGRNVQTLGNLRHLDIYFDGCDQVNYQLHALKSGGGIHTQEKLAAFMADEFIILGDTGKLVETFDTKYPVVLEILPEAFQLVPNQLHKSFESICGTYRASDKKDGLVITQNGNFLFDLYFKDFPELSSLNGKLKSIPGIVETSLFYNLCTKAILAGNNGIQVVEK